MTTAPLANNADAVRSRMNDRMRRALAIHFDPKHGTAFWLERQQQLGFDVRSEMQDISGLDRLGEMTPADMADRPLTDFVPRALHSTHGGRVIAQTGGTTGTPVWTAYSQSEFEEAFVTPFQVAATHVGFPRQARWLYAGPSGPHVIGRAANELARSLDSAPPFTVDFDPRWAKKLPSGSFAQQRYLEHVIDQAIEIIEVQGIEVIFTTPIILAALARGMPPAQRERIRGVHYGGTHLATEALAEFQGTWFPNAMHLSGYGNTLFGCCLELDVSLGRVPTYFPFGDRLIFRTHTSTPPQVGPRGRISFTRLDETMLLVNVVERDAAELVEPLTDAPDGFCRAGLRGVAPCDEGPAPATGLY